MEPTPKPKGWGSRYEQAILMFFGFFIAYAMRVNLSVGIVAMMDPASELTPWNSAERGLVLSSFFWGYMVPQVPAGFLATRWGPCRFLAAGVFAAGIINFLTPIAAIHGGWLGVCITRIFNGLFQGFLHPCVTTHMSKWSVPEERRKLYSFCFGGQQFGTMAMLLIGGVLASRLGWPSIFYVSGSFGVIWGVICAFFGVDSPLKHKTISEKEKMYILSSLPDTSDKPIKTPCKDIATSVPMWAYLVVHLGYSWCYWTLLTLMPTYINGVLKFDIQNNGFLSALPYFSMWLTGLIMGAVADVLVKKNIISHNVSSKMWTSIAHYGGCITLLTLAYVTPNVTTAVFLLTLVVSLSAAATIGYFPNHLDLAPNLAGTLMGISNGLANTTAILGPLVSSYILTDQSNIQQWKLVFLISAVIYLVGNTTFIVFGSTEIQPWNEPKTNYETNKSLEISQNRK